MARILYIFPHPDDESFGPGPVMARQRREGHEVFLLTLTHGEATSQRHKYGYSKEEMGVVRRREMEGVARLLDLAEMRVLSLPDGGLADLDPRRLERVVADYVRHVQPDVVVTYAVHGISGHPDHLAGHAAVKRVFCVLRDEGTVPSWRRLAFFTLQGPEGGGRPAHLRSSPDEHIDCIVRFDAEDRARGMAALDCYETYRDVVREHQPLKTVAEGVCFELFDEQYTPPLDDLTADLIPARDASTA